MCALKLEDTITFPRKVVTIHKNAPLVEAIGLMRRNSIHHLVVTEGERPLGVLSDRDIMQKGFASHSVVLNPIMSVGEAMHPLTQALTDKSDLSDAISLMHNERVSALPLMSQGKLSGIVTESDLLTILRTLLGAVPADAEAEELDASEKGRLMLGNPLVQNLMKLLSEAGI